MRSLSFIAIVAFLFSSCRYNFMTELEVNQPIKLVQGKIFKKEKTIPPGGYQAKISVSKNYIRLGIDGIGKWFRFTVPGGSKHLPDNGVYNLSSNQSGQPLDLTMDVTTGRRKSEQKERFVGCSIPKRRMRPVCPDGRIWTPGSEFRRRECPRQPRIINIPGQKRVKFHVVYERSKYHFDFKQPGSGMVVASSRGEKNNSWEVNDYEGPCRRNPRNRRFDSDIDIDIDVDINL